MGQIFKIHEIHLVVRQAASRQERTTDRTDGTRTRTQAPTWRHYSMNYVEGIITPGMIYLTDVKVALIHRFRLEIV
jgi:hypothetical protein